MTRWTTLLALVATCAAAPANAQMRFYAVPRGSPRPLLTEVWAVRPDGSGARHIRTYPGEPGDLIPLPEDGELIYLESGLSCAVFGSYLCGGRAHPLSGGRVWRLKADGSGETPWPLPDGLRPLRISVSPDGAHLTVRTRDEGLWAVDRLGNATRLPDAPSRAAPSGPADPGFHPPPVPGLEAALSRIGTALDAWVRGYHAMHRGDRRAERRGYEAALRAFEALLRTEPGVSKGSGLGILQTIRAQIDRTEEERQATVCQDRLLVLAGLFAHDSGAQGGSLQDLSRQVERRIETGAQDPAIRARDLAVLAQTLRCPADPHPDRQISYLPGTEEPLACFWHRGRLFGLDGTRVTSAPFGPDRIDALAARAERHLGEGEMERALSLLEVGVHQRPRDAAARLRLGHAALRAGDLARAEKAFKEAAVLSRGQALARAYYGLGLVCLERPRGLYAAIDYFRDALTRDRGYVDARYQMARARYLLWEYDARADIEEVLRLDPGHAEAYRLMGDWYADLKEDYGQAIPWYAKYVAMRPDDPEGRRRLSAAYLKVRDYGRVLETLMAFVQAHPSATEVLPIVAQACVRQGKLDMASGFYRAYISRLSAEERALYEDVSLIAPAEELADSAVAPEAGREAFFRRFWSHRDPDLSTPVNERLLEHYWRVWYARQTFSKGREPWDRRGEVYVRFGEPDHRTSSLMMNASQTLAAQRVKERMALDLYGSRGLGETYVGPVFPVRSIAAWEGPRDHEALASTGGVEVARDQENGTRGARSTQEEYVTRREQRGRDAGAQARSGNAEARLRFGDTVGSADLSRIEALKGEFSERREGFLRFGEYRPVLASDADISRVAWESWVYPRIGGGIEITFTDESGRGAYDYAPTPTAPDISVEQMGRFVRHAPRRLVDRAVAASPDFYALDSDAGVFDFSFDLADFRGRGGRSALEVYYGIPHAAARRVAEEGVDRLVVERHVTLTSAASDTVYRASGDLVHETESGGGKGAFVPDLVRLEVPPGDYRLEVRARDRMTGRLGIYRREVRVKAYGPEGLRMSDLELAWRISGGQPGNRFSKGDLLVVPMPTRGYRKGQGVFVYHEVYNLALDGQGRTNYQVEYMIGAKEGGILSRLVRTFVGKGEEVSMGHEGRGSREMEAVHKELDLGGLDAGRYTLRVTVTDLNNRQTAAKETFFSVGE